MTLNSNINNISMWAFQYCSSLTSITIPESVTTVGANAFEGCTWLNSVIFENTEGWRTGAYGESVSPSWITDNQAVAEFLRAGGNTSNLYIK